MSAKRAWKPIGTAHWMRSNRRIKRLSRTSASKGQPNDAGNHRPVSVLVPLWEFKLIELRIVAGARLPPFPKDFQPALTRGIVRHRRGICPAFDASGNTFRPKGRKRGSDSPPGEMNGPVNLAYATLPGSVVRLLLAPLDGLPDGNGLTQRLVPLFPIGLMDGAGRQLTATTRFDGVVEPQDDRTRRHKGIDQQAQQQHAGGLSRAVVVLKIGFAGQPQGAGCGGDGVVWLAGANNVPHRKACARAQQGRVNITWR
jgi:hypothetical protein